MSQSLALLYAGWVGNLTSLGGLQSMAGLTNHDAAKLCGVARETYRRWRTDRPFPLYASRLLAVRAGYVPWAGWERWFYNPCDRTLNHIDLKNGFSPSKMAEFLFLRQTYEQAAARAGVKKGGVISGLSRYRQAQGEPRPGGLRFREFRGLRATSPGPVRARPAATPPPIPPFIRTVSCPASDFAPHNHFSHQRREPCSHQQNKSNN